MLPNHEDASDRFLEVPSQLLRDVSIAIENNRNGVAFDTNSQSMPLPVGNIDAKGNRFIPVVRICAIEKFDVASKRKNQLLLAAVTIDSEEYRRGVVYSRISIKQRLWFVKRKR